MRTFIVDCVHPTAIASFRMYIKARGTLAAHAIANDRLASEYGWNNMFQTRVTDLWADALTTPWAGSITPPRA